MKEYTIKQAMEQVLAVSDGTHLGLIFTHDDARQVLAALDASRTPMTEDEILQRARRAAAAVVGHMTEDEILQRARRAAAAVVGHMTPGIVVGDILESTQAFTAAAQALRDLDKPLVDSVVATVRELCAKHAETLNFENVASRWRSGDNDDSVAMKYAIAAYRAGSQSK